MLLPATAALFLAKLERPPPLSPRSSFHPRDLLLNPIPPPGPPPLAAVLAGDPAIISGGNNGQAASIGCDLSLCARNAAMPELTTCELGLPARYRQRGFRTRGTPCTMPSPRSASIYGCDASIYGCTAPIHGSNAAVYGGSADGGRGRSRRTRRTPQGSGVPRAGSQVPICLRAPYAMSGTEIAYAAICLRARYAMSGTDIA
eukprot:1868859-Rhodomonas_salina.3